MRLPGKPVLLGAAAAAVYALGAARTAIWADASKLTLYALAPYVPSLNPGDHPGWTVLAWLWLHLPGVRDPVRACHLLSALLGGLAVGLAAALLERSGRSPAGAVLLAVAHPVWWASSLAETYTASLVAVLLVALLATEKGTVAAVGGGIAAGWGAAVHGFTLPLTVPLLVSIPRRWWPATAAGAVLGSSPAWLAVLGSPADPLTGHRAGGVSAWGWHLRAFLDPGRASVGLVGLWALVLFAVGPIGLVALARRGTGNPVHPWPMGGWGGLAALVVVLALYAPYRLHLMTGFVVLGLFLLRPPRLGRVAVVHLLVQTTLYLGAPLALEAAGFGALGVRQLPHRHNARYFLWPWKACESGAERYAHELLAAAPPGAVVLGDFNPGTVLVLVQRVRGVRPDVRIIPTAVDETLGGPDPAAALVRAIRRWRGQPVVLADGWPSYYRLDEVERRFGYRFTRCGPGWLVLPPGRTRSATTTR